MPGLRQSHLIWKIIFWGSITQAHCSLDKHPRLLQQANPLAKLMPIWALQSNCHVEATALCKDTHYLISRQVEARLRWWAFSFQTMLDVFHGNCDDGLEIVFCFPISSQCGQLKYHFHKGKIMTLMRI